MSKSWGSNLASALWWLVRLSVAVVLSFLLMMLFISMGGQFALSVASEAVEGGQLGTFDVMMLYCGVVGGFSGGAVSLLPRVFSWVWSVHPVSRALAAVASWSDRRRSVTSDDSGPDGGADGPGHVNSDGDPSGDADGDDEDGGSEDGR